MLRKIDLNGQQIEYTLKRSQRRTIGFQVSSNGLVIRAPACVALTDIEKALQDKADWVIKNLARWKNKKSLDLTWEINATFPLLGEPWKLSTDKLGQVKLVPLAKVNHKLPLPPLNAWFIEQIVMNWYQDQAIECFEQRLAIYAEKLNIARPPFRLSNAKTRWGSCNANGIIYLNWRLVQLPLHIVDYVVAHELSHLFEMNHSDAFWRQVKSIYPNYVAARNVLKGYDILRN